MAFFQLVLKARNLEKVRQNYEDEKLTSIKISKGAKHRFTFKQSIRRKKLWIKKKVRNMFSKITSILEGTWLHKMFVAITTEGTLENYIAKSFFGFVGGIILTYIFFIFFVFQLNFKLSSATFICTILGAILTLGLAFSPRVRCIVFLILPQFFSKRGRQALMAYAFILALTGPVKNILHNTAVLSESLACAQEQLKEAVKTVIDLAKQPFYALREAISKVIKSVKAVVKKIKQTLIAIKRLVLSILRVITSVFQWLGSVINMCNKKLGTPFDRCQNVFDGAVADCKAKLGPIFGVVCNITYIVSTLCYVVKPLDFICMLVAYISDSVVGTVRDKIKKFTMHMKAMFYVKVKFSHSFQFETNQSKTMQEVSTDIATEIRERTDTLFGVFDWMSFVTSFFIFFILLRALRYRYKWLTSERFDNYYITNDLRTIDLIRARQDKETVLPLNPREQNKYVPLTSVILIKSEKIKLTRSAVFLGLATMKLIAYMSIDYSLYWVLHMIQIHGRFQSKVERPSIVTIHVSGDGYLADLYRSIVKAFTPHGKETEIDTMVCLPDPIRPNLDKYIQITVLIIFCWLIALFEPYGLRLRHVVLCQYYPDRSKQRAAWLYNHIIRTRGSFLKFARRQLRRRFGLGNGEKIEKVTFKEKLWAICPCLNVLFPLKQNMCLLCGAVERADGNPHVKCPTPGCVGLFCTQCFADLQNLCTICRSPIEYGDLSDMSEEKDSSEDQFEMPQKALPKPDIKEEEPKTEEKEEETEVTDTEETKPLLEEEEKEESEEPMKTEKEVAEQTDDKYVGHSDQSSESTYSYTYQDESPEEAETGRLREPFKDVEAQKIKDDVTIQIFNQPLVRQPSSSTESPASPFVVRARRKVRAKLKKRPDDAAVRMRHSDSSTSIADTESWSTEEVEEEEVIHVEADDASKELLPKDQKDKAKLGRINRIIAAVARIPWLGVKEDDGNECKSLQRRRPSLMNKIIYMLERGQSLPLQSYRRSRRTRDSSSSSSCSCDSESRTLLKIRDKRNLRSTKSRGWRAATEDESDEMEYLKRIQCKRKFATKQLPKYLESTVKDTCYYEVDETKDSPRRTCVRQPYDIDELSNAKWSDTWSMRKDDRIGPCTCTSDISFEITGDKDYRPRKRRTVSEQTDTTSKMSVETETEFTSKSETDYSKETSLPTKQKHKKDEHSEYPESKDSDETRGDLTKTEEEKTDIEEKKQEKSVITKYDVPKSTAEKKEEHIISTEEVKETPGIEVSQLYDPLAGLELYGVGYKTKRKVIPARREVTMEEKIIEPQVEDVEDKRTPPDEKLKPLIVASEAPEPSEEKTILTEEGDKFARGESTKVDAANENAPAEPHIVTKVDKATDLPDKTRSTQTKFRKRDSKLKHPAQDIKDSDTKTSDKISKLGRDVKKEKPSREKKKHKKRCKTDKWWSSKRKRDSCSDRSTFTCDEEYYIRGDISDGRSLEESGVTGEWEPCENVYSAHECQYYPGNDDTDVCRSSAYVTPCGTTSTGYLETKRDRFEMPVIKKYLPMYQSPELIEELKRHDRMKLIREEEAERRRFKSPSPSPDSFSICSRPEEKRATPTRNVPVNLMKKTDKLAYQATQAYRNVICELQKRTGRRKKQKKNNDDIPLIQLSRRADSSKKVQQLYSRQKQSGKKSGLMKRLSNRIITPFKPVKKHERRLHAENIRVKGEAVCCDCSYKPQVMSDISSICSCVEESQKFITSTSADEKTDNKSTR